MNAAFHTPMRLTTEKSPLERELKDLLGIDIETCLECGKCSGGCSNGHIFDYTPRKMVQLLRLGAEQTLLKMDALWVCLSCQLCFDRCPSGIDIPRILDHLREKARRRGIPATRPAVLVFHDLMLDQVRTRGRVAEVGLMLRFLATTGQYGKDAGLGLRMLLKGKLNPFAPAVKGAGEMKRLCDDSARR